MSNLIKFEKNLLMTFTPIGTVISVLESCEQKIIFALDSDRRLSGTLTDGDLRRGLLSGLSLADTLQSFMNKEYLSFTHDDNKDEILSMALKQNIGFVPLLSKEGLVLDILCPAESVQHVRRPNPVVLMAGGRGSRLGALTRKCPKPMLEIDGTPMLEILLKQCVDAGFFTFFISVNYLAEYIKDYFGDGSKWGVSINYLEEKEPLGTAGPLAMLRGFTNIPLLVVNGDILCKVNYAELVSFHEKKGSLVTVGVRHHTSQVPFGVLDVNEENKRIISIEEKPIRHDLISMGACVVSPETLGVIGPGYFDMPDFLRAAIANGYPVMPYMVYENWIDVGIPETFARAQFEWHQGS